MIINSKVHAYKVLSYVLCGVKEREKAEIIGKSMTELQRFKFRFDEEVFFNEICKKKEGLAFMQANKISTLEELVTSQYEYFLKFEKRIYMSVKGEIDYCFDDVDSEEYLD